MIFYAGCAVAIDADVPIKVAVDCIHSHYTERKKEIKISNQAAQGHPESGGHIHYRGEYLDVFVQTPASTKQ